MVAQSTRSTRIGKSDSEKDSLKLASCSNDSGVLPKIHRSRSECGLNVFVTLDPKTTT